jgi:hypothetical protein
MPCSNVNVVNDLPHLTKGKLLKIVDVLGRETFPINNTILFYIYDDGTIEKRVVIK